VILYHEGWTHFSAAGRSDLVVEHEIFNNA